ncbi:MAG: hypothetical protein K6E49_05895 [Lachnospiraceae bacterium]|nr:hypothetical protein [Lachnospiraceae bacterium]
MKILKFCLKCILAALPAIALIAFTLLCPMCYMDEEYPSWRLEGEIADGKVFAGEDFDTVILGDSGAMSALIPEMFDGNCVNLALGGATSLEMYYYLDRYLSCHEAPETVIIMFAPFHYWNVDNYATRTVYFKAIPFNRIKEVYTNAFSCDSPSVWNDGPVNSELRPRCGLPSVYLPALKAARFTGRYDDNKRAYEELIRTKGWGSFGTAESCYDESYETSYKDLKVTGDTRILALYLQKIMRLCDEHDIHIRLIQPAVNNATFDNLNEHYYASYRNFIKEAATVSDDIEYETELRVYDGKYFSDSSHLNRKGAEKFTKEILETQ